MDLSKDSDKYCQFRRNIFLRQKELGDSTILVHVVDFLALSTLALKLNV
jgi:hypothetical protein